MDDIQQDGIQSAIDEQSLLDKLQVDLNEAMNGWKRTAADFENYRRRKEAENQELITFAREVAIAKLLPTLDSLEQALRHVPEMNDELRSMNQDFTDKYQSWQKGIQALVGQLDKALEELGVKKIASVGKKFDPNYHEAVREVESEHDDGVVVDELQTGFELNGKVIRPSQVTISKRKSQV